MKVFDYGELFQSRFVNLFLLRGKDKNNNDVAWTISSRSQAPKCLSGTLKTPDAVIIVALHRSSQKLIVTKEFRYPLNDYEYGLPAGLVDEGESPEVAAERELFEETGLEMTKVLRVSPTIFSSTGITDESVVMVYMECEGEPSTKFLEGSEDIETFMVSQEEAGEMLANSDYLFGAKGYFVMENFARYGEV